MIIPKNLWEAHEFQCSCGMTHSQPIKEIVIQKGAVEKLSRIRETRGAATENA